jgi:hypothetical protein
MEEGAHARHQPPLNEDPVDAGEHAPTLAGLLYPVGDILAIIRDRADAERAAEALKAAGVPAGDINLVDGPWFVEEMKSVKAHRNPVERVMAFLAVEEREFIEEYAEHGARGDTIMVVHAQQPPVCGHVGHILAQHGATSMRHYGRLVITDIPE